MKSATVHKIGYYLVLAITFLTPLFFLPITSEFYEFNKHYLLLISAVTLLSLWSVSFIVDRQVKLIRNPFTLPLLSVAAAWIISTIARTPNRLDALIDPGQTGTIVALTIIFITGISFIKTKRELEILVHTLLISLSALASITALWSTGVMTKAIPWTFAQNPLWNPSGSPIGTLVLLVIFLPFLGVYIAKQKEDSTKILLLSVALFLFVSAAGLITYRIFRDSNSRPLFLSQTSSWAIALEALKISPVIGTGANTYLSDFTRFRPLSHNLTSAWNIRFNSASNYYMQILATLGFIGLASMSFLTYKTIRLFLRALRSPSESIVHTPALAASITATLLLLSFFFIPPTVTTSFILYLLFIVIVVSFKLMGSPLVHEANVDIIAASESGVRTPMLPWISLLMTLLLIVPFANVLANSYAAEFMFQKSLEAASRNDGRSTYNNIYQAIRFNPLRDTYHVAASQTNLMLANSSAAKKDLTADEREVISKLVQQSIQEAKNAVALNPTKVTNLENLATVYQNLMNFAQGADEWAIASYRQAMILDPNNPTLNISLGGILYARKNYDEALRLFLRAADLKPDYANAYYNISATYREKKDYQNAYLAMQTVTNLIDKSSSDYAKAKGEMDELAKLVGEKTPVVSEPAKSELESPKPATTPKVNPPINLPSELGPETSSTPTPTSSPAPKISPTVAAPAN